MKVLGIGLCATLALATAARADKIASDKFDDWINSLNQKGWRLVSVSEPVQQALLIGPTLSGPDGRRITELRYELMDGPYRSLVVADEINCGTREITRTTVTGYPQNNMGGPPVQTPANLPQMKVAPNSFQETEVGYACGPAKAVAVRVATSANPAPEPGEQIVCKTERPMGSLVPARFCQRKLDADRDRQEWRDAIERAQREIPTIH